MFIKYTFLIIVLNTIAVSCGSNDTTKTENKIEKKPLEIIPTGIEDVQQLLEHLSSKEIQINQTSTAELAVIYEIEPNDYYMNKKVELEDHVLYINFTISKGVLTKVSFASLSNSPKDFSYITNLVTQHFGEDFTQTYNTNDSVADNATKNWQLDSLTVQLETFSDLNSGYEITLE